MKKLTQLSRSLKKLNLENEKISLKEISFKKLNVKNKILIDLEDRSKIIQSAKFFLIIIIKIKHYLRNICN